MWSTSQRIRYFKGETVARPGVNGTTNTNTNGGRHPPHAPRINGVRVDTEGGGGGVLLTDDSIFGVAASSSSAAAAAAKSAASGGLRISAVFGDALAQAFRRRSFHRFLDALRSITKELPALGSIRWVARDCYVGRCCRAINR